VASAPNFEVEEVFPATCHLKMLNIVDTLDAAVLKLPVATTFFDQDYK
jgi:hypothetical protein